MPQYLQLSDEEVSEYFDRLKNKKEQKMKLTEFRDKIARNQDGPQKQNIAEIADTLEDINRNTNGDFYEWIEGLDSTES